MENLNLDWNIVNMDRHSLDGIVFTVHYTVVANDGHYVSSTYGAVNLEYPEENIIPYEDLTPEVVVEWTKDALGEDKVSEIETTLISQIEQQRNPPTLTGTPWSTTL